MRGCTQDKWSPVRAALAAAIVVALGSTIVAAGYDYDQDNQQNQQYQQWQQGATQPPNQGNWQQSNESSARNWGQASGTMEGRDLPLERQVADRLRQEGFGMEGQIMVLAIGNRVILLGVVPDQQQKQQAQQVTRQVSGVQQVDNRLQVSSEVGPQNDSQLRQDIQQQLQHLGGAEQNVQVQARNGRVTLSGQVNDWQQVADVIAAAFAAGAQNVTSRLTTVGQSPTGTAPGQYGESTGQYGQPYEQPYGQYGQPYGQGAPAGQGYYPPYGYAPGQAGQRQPWTGGAPQGFPQQRFNPNDLVLAHEIALRLQQELPPGENVHIMDPEGIYVSVSQGTVMLDGYVRSSDIKQQAGQIARSVSGMQNIDNQLMVAGEGGSYQAFGYVPGQSSQSQGQGGNRQDRMGGQGQQQNTTGRQSTHTSDMILIHQIALQLQRQFPGEKVYSMNPQDIYIHVAQGTVRLYGTAQNENEKQQISRIARSIPGVQNVENSLQVWSGGQAGAYPALGYVPGPETPGPQPPAGPQPSTGTGISGDTQCIQMLKQKLTDQNLRNMAQNIYVTCHNGTMALYGYVSSDQDKNQLEKLTKSIPGINEVDNNLIVRKGGAEQKSDADLKEDVESQLWWSPYVDSDKIQVSVQNGTVTLAGQADSWDAMRAAVKNAFDAGAKRVRSEIQYPQSQSGRQSGSSTESSMPQSGTSQDGQSQSSGTGNSSSTGSGSY